MKTNMLLTALAVLCFLSPGVQAQLNPEVLVRAGNNEKGGEVEGMAMLSNGNSVMVGWKGRPYVMCLGYVTLLDPNGKTIREIFLGQDGVAGDVRAEKVVEDPATGGFYVSAIGAMDYGEFKGDNIEVECNAYLMKFDARGNRIWLRGIQGPYRIEYDGIGISPDGNLLAAVSYTNGSFGPRRMELLTYSPDGRVLNKKPINMPYPDYFDNVMFEQDGKGNYWMLFFASSDKKDRSTKKLYLQKINARGDLLHRYAFDGCISIMITGLEPMKDGGVLVTMRNYGSEGDFSGIGAYCFRFDAQARKLWDVHYNSDGNEEPFCIATEDSYNGDIYMAVFTPDKVPELHTGRTYRHNVYVVRMDDRGRKKSSKALYGLAFHQSPKRMFVRNSKLIIGIEGQISADRNLSRGLEPFWCRTAKF